MASYHYNRGFIDSIPPVTKNLLIINVLVWVATFVLKGKGVDLDLYLGLHFWKGSDFGLWQFVTYMFMHDTSSLGSGFTHIFFNMFSLWMFGRILEPVMGRTRYLTYYVVCGLGAALVQELVWQFTWPAVAAGMFSYGGVAGVTTAQLQQAIATGAIPASMLNQCFNAFVTIGASGAVFGILLAFGMLFPNMPLYIIPFPFPIKAKWMVIGYGLVELVFGVTGEVTSVAHFAHLGGMLFGFLLLLYWRKTKHMGRGYEYMD